MRIGITCYPTYGGSGIVATELGLELAARGHDVHFISYANPIRLDSHPGIHYHEVEVTSYPLFQFPPYCLALASRMAEVAERERLDLLHVHYAIPHSISALLAQQMMTRRLPFVTTLHGTDITLVGAEPSYFPITKFSIEKSDAVTAISQHLRRHTEQVFGITREIQVINNFVNLKTYRPAPERRPARPTLIHISNFRPVKRTPDCVRVLAAVRRHVDAELIMVGDGPERGPAERTACELGVWEHTRFEGKQNKIAEWLQRAHVLLLPSEMESFGLAALEGMACGTVPVATRVGGVPEVITDGADGFLCPVGDVEAQAARVLDALSRHEPLAAAARATAEREFGTERIIPQYEAVYRAL